MAGNTRFKSEDGILVSGAAGVNSEIYTDLNVYGNLVANDGVLIVGNSIFANATFGSNNALVVDVVHNQVAIGTNTLPAGVQLNINGNTQITGNLTVNGSVFFVNGNLTVVGNLIFANVQTSGLLANVDQAPLGNSTFRFDGFFYDVIVYHQLNPSANNIALGNTTSRWLLNANTGNFSGNIQAGANTLFVDTVTNRVSVNGASDGTSALTVTGTANIQGNTTVNGSVTANSFVLPDAVITSNIVTITANTQQIVDSFPKTQTQCVKYIVFAKANGAYEVLEILLITDANSAVVQSTYSDVYNAKIGTMDAAINNANVEVYFTAPSANSSNSVTVKTQKIYLY